MPAGRPLTILCISSYEKGQEFIRQCKARACRVLLVTVEKLRDANWPRDCIDEIFAMPADFPLQDLIHSVSYLARSQPLDRIVPLDEFDMENAAALREHLRVPGMGLTSVRYFRDKLAMRAQARDAGVPVPEFAHVLNYDALREYLGRVEPPWLLKPRSQASGIGMTKLQDAAELWPLLDQLGDQQSFFLLEQFIPGDVYHVDSVVSEREVVFAEAHEYGHPPFEVAHQGGVFTTRTLPRSSAVARALLQSNHKLIRSFGLVRGVTHAEFLKSHEDGRFYFLEIAARVGGAHIADVVEAATGINLWREWANIEVGGGKEPYQLPKARRDYSGVILSLARQEHPDTSAYSDPEIAMRIEKYHHAGFVFRSPRPKRIAELMDSYAARFHSDFVARQPIPDKPTS